MMYTTSNGDPCSTIVSCDSHTKANSFYNELSSLVRHILTHIIRIICGDMNDHIGKKQIINSNLSDKIKRDFSKAVAVSVFVDALPGLYLNTWKKQTGNNTKTLRGVLKKSSAHSGPEC